MSTTVKFTSMQMEYGDLDLVHYAIEKCGWFSPPRVFPILMDRDPTDDGEDIFIVHSVQRPGFEMEPDKFLHLKWPSKLIGHSEWREGWFRPDLWGPHMDRLVAATGVKYELLNEPGCGPVCRVQVRGKEWKCRRPLNLHGLNAVRLLYLTALTHGN